MKSHLLTCLTFLCLVTCSLGGGSVKWTSHALPILKQHPELLAIIENSLDV